VSENKVRRKGGLQVFTILFYAGALKGEKAVFEMFYGDAFSVCLFEKKGRALLRFRSPRSGSGEYDPAHFYIVAFVAQPQDGAAAPDLDVVSVSAETQELPG
jgi:hypothetical protein